MCVVDARDQRQGARAALDRAGPGGDRHRFAFALAHGVQACAAVPVLGHRCDNPLCQRIGPGHVVASSYVENRREWAARRALTGSPLGDARGARVRAQELRDLARADPGLLGEELARLRRRYGEQPTLW